MKPFRVRFAPSPTGALHIGGIRTALYNYILAKKNKGTFILRIEDTDQTRYVPGAEAYIMESLNWCGLIPDEGIEQGGPYGPYRQSERKDIYQQYVRQLIDSGHAYYAFDTPDELEEMRRLLEKEGEAPKYDYKSRMSMVNSLTLGSSTTQAMIGEGVPHVVRLKVPADQIIQFKDLIRGDVEFSTNELDDKVLLKSDGLPTYHLANVVDDYLMKISHVIRGEEWLSSTAHHILLYRAFGWENDIPLFSHLPLILKPDGHGKLSKRDGARFGFPVFPLSWVGETSDDSFTGFREIGFNPSALLNFLALVGWNPGTDQEIFSMQDLIEVFSFEKISKGGARFDFEKAKWFNQQYIQHQNIQEIEAIVGQLLTEKGYEVSHPFLKDYCRLYQPRVTLYNDFVSMGHYFFEDIALFDEKTIQKKWATERKETFIDLRDTLVSLEFFEAVPLKLAVESFIQQKGWSFGDVLPILRIALCGTMQGPDIFEVMALMGREKVNDRLPESFDKFDLIKS